MFACRCARSCPSKKQHWVRRKKRSRGLSFVHFLSFRKEKQILDFFNFCQVCSVVSWTPSNSGARPRSTSSGHGARFDFFSQAPCSNGSSMKCKRKGVKVEERTKPKIKIMYKLVWNIKENKECIFSVNVILIPRYDYFVGSNFSFFFLPWKFFIQ